MDGIIVRARQETEALLSTPLCSFFLMKAQRNESGVHVPEVRLCCSVGVKACLCTSSVARLSYI